MQGAHSGRSSLRLRRSKAGSACFRRLRRRGCALPLPHSPHQTTRCLPLTPRLPAGSLRSPPLSFLPKFPPHTALFLLLFHKFLISRIYFTKFSVNFCPLFTNLRMEKEKILQSCRAGDILNLVKRKENIAITEYRAGPPAMSKPYITSNEQRVDSAMGCPSHSACLLSFCFIHRVRPAGWVAPQRKTIDNVIFTGGCLNGLFTDRQ